MNIGHHSKSRAHVTSFSRQFSQQRVTFTLTSVFTVHSVRFLLRLYIRISLAVEGLCVPIPTSSAGVGGWKKAEKGKGVRGGAGGVIPFKAYTPASTKNRCVIFVS